MKSKNEDVIIYSIDEKRFWNRVGNVIGGFVFLVSILILVILFTSKTPIKDGLLIFGVFSVYGLFIFILPQVKSVHKLIFDAESIQIQGNIFNSAYSKDIPLKNIKLSVQSLGRGKISGYQMVIQADGRRYLVSHNNGWSTLDIYEILLDIKEQRNLLKIHREDGIHRIQELEQFLSGNSPY